MSLVSIVVPMYNCEKYIGDTIKSALSQTYTDWELIFVDNCSPDKSYEAITPFLSDKRIRYIKLDKNSGAATARNKGIEAAQGRYIAFLDSDDIYDSSKPEKSLAFMRENDAAVICTDYVQMQENGEHTGRIIRCKHKCDYKTCVRTNHIGTSTVIYDSSILGKVHMPLVPKREDFAAWLRMLLADVDSVYGVCELLCYYRIVKGSVSRNKFKMIKYQYRLFHNFEHFSYCVRHIIPQCGA